MRSEKKLLSRVPRQPELRSSLYHLGLGFQREWEGLLGHGELGESWACIGKNMMGRIAGGIYGGDGLRQEEGVLSGQSSGPSRALQVLFSETSCSRDRKL